MNRVRMGDILQLHRGYDLPEVNREKGTVPIISSSGFSGWHNKYKCSGPNVITGRYGTIGEVYYYDGKCWPLNTALYVNDFKGNNPRYIYYLLKYILKVDGTDKSTVPGVDRNVLHEMKVPFCEDTVIQAKTIGILENIDSKIENNNSICSDLEAMAKLLYDYWFVQFDFPDENGKPYKSSGGKMVWNEELKREIPEGWKTKRLLDIIDWIGTSQPPKSTFRYTPCDGYIRFIQNRDYDDDTHLTFIPLEENTRTCAETDIMMDKYGDAGKIRYGIAGAYNVALSKISVRDESMKEYVRSYLGSKEIYGYLHSACIASTRASLNEANLSFLSIVIPTRYLLNRFNSIAEEVIETVLSVKKENEQLASLRDFLLPMLMNGQVKVSDNVVL